MRFLEGTTSTTVYHHGNSGTRNGSVGGPLQAFGSRLPFAEARVAKMDCQSGCVSVAFVTRLWQC